MLDEPTVRACLARHWDLPDARVEAHHGGMGSATWLVSSGGRRRVAKSVARPQGAQFAGGLSVAALVDAAGIPAGAPVPTLVEAYLRRPVLTAAEVERALPVML